MGRPSKFTELMRAEIGKRLASGESFRAVSKSTGIPFSTLRDNFAAQLPEVRDVARALASVESRLLSLPVSAQRAVRSLADKLKTIQEDFADTAVRSTKTARIFAGLAGKMADAIDIDDETIKPEIITNVAIAGELTKIMNLALVPASNMIAANRTEAVPTIQDDGDVEYAAEAAKVKAMLAKRKTR